MDNAVVETLDYQGHIIDIYYDEYADSPRQNDNIGVIHCAHKRYALGDIQHNTYESIKEAEQECKKDGDVVLPIYMYDHSGITISLTPFSCPWDSGQIGFISIPRKKMLEEFSAKIFTKQLKEKAVHIAQGEIEEYDQFLMGEVYGYVVKMGGEKVDNCWGYYGLEECIEEAKRVVDYQVKNNLKKHAQQLKQWIVNKVPLNYRYSLETNS